MTRSALALGALGIAIGLVVTAIPAAPALADGSAQSLPKLDGHISDPANQLSAADRLALDHRLEDFRLRTGFAIVALVVDSLHGEPVEDLAYRAFNTWKIGEAGKDNGILIVIATGDRRVRIETGKGVGGALTDLQSADIIHNVMGPLLKQGKFAEAIDSGSQAIEAALRGDPAAAPGKPVHGSSETSLQMWILIGLLVIFFPVTILLSVISPRFRNWLRSLGNNSGGGGGYYGGGGFGGSSGGGGDSGSGYSGGGGSSGGGGASDSF